jgi:hypothetical protein
MTTLTDCPRSDLMPGFVEGLTPTALYALSGATTKIEATPDDMTRVGKVVGHATNDDGQAVPILVYEDGAREKIPNWSTPLPLVGSLVRYGFVYRTEVAQLVYGKIAQ